MSYMSYMHIYTCASTPMHLHMHMHVHTHCVFVAHHAKEHRGKLGSCQSAHDGLKTVTFSRAPGHAPIPFAAAV